MHHLRFRQIHLDFHTSPAIPEIGVAFDKSKWQATLQAGHVNSITCFAKCHHGWSYHPTEVGQVHPHLEFDLLRAQFDACKEIDVNVPIYISAGVDNVASYEHPEWREVGPDGTYCGWARGVIDAGFHKMCFHSPYLDYLCEQIKESVRLFPDCDGIFLDIISHGQCCCRWCLEVMEEHDLDATREEDRKACARLALLRYYKETTEACKVDNPDMPVFHNSGHVTPGKRDILEYFSHLELESLPTGGWGYDHFPMSAKYVINLEHDIMGMTGKFHTTWGEFGGFKHPNALRYECAAMLAYGSKCSVGDQLHPNGALDASTYEIIGAAYAEVEAKEPWCDNVESVADIGLLLNAAVKDDPAREEAADVGAGRILLEGHFLFDVLDTDMDFNRYKMLVLPDGIPVDNDLKERLQGYLDQGGKLFLSGTSGIGADGPVFDLGAEWTGESKLNPDYILPVEGLQPIFCHSPMVMYANSQRIKVTRGESLGDIYDTYFNRTFKHFCSHQHTPNKPTPSGFACGVLKGQILYLAHPVFSIYRNYGQVALKDYVVACLRRLLGDDMTLKTSLPSTARVSLMRQPDENRYILHLLYANTIRRGGPGGRDLEVVEHLQPLLNTQVKLKLPQDVMDVTLEPQGEQATAAVDGGKVKLKIDRFSCHQMVVLNT